MLKERVATNPKNYRQCSVIIDGMSIRKYLDWDPKCQQMVGFIYLGAGSLNNDVEEAKEVIVIMAAGLQSQWKIPVGYLIDVILSQLVLSVISSLLDVKANVLAVVMDGHTINLPKMVNVPSCKIMSDIINSSFPHPSDSSQNVYVFFYACHLLKNVRAALHALQEINTSVGIAR